MGSISASLGRIYVLKILQMKSGLCLFGSFTHNISFFYIFTAAWPDVSTLMRWYIGPKPPSCPVQMLLSKLAAVAAEWKLEGPKNLTETLKVLSGSRQALSPKSSVAALTLKLLFMA